MRVCFSLASLSWASLMRPLLERQTAHPLPRIAVEVVRRRQTKFGIIRRQSPSEFLAERFVRLNDAVRGVLNLFDGQGVQGISEGDAQTVPLQAKRDSPHLLRQVSGNFGERVR